MTVTTLPRTKLRHRVDDNERVHLAKVAACGKYGFMVERGQESKAEQILVEDGYLSRDVVPGMSRSYAKFTLTEMGRRVLALKGERS